MSIEFEAVAFIVAGQVVREFRYPEFEAVLDGFVKETEYLNKEVEAVYMTLNGKLQILGMVLFRLRFSREGLADSRWNLPLRYLATQPQHAVKLAGQELLVCDQHHCREQNLKAQLWSPEGTTTLETLLQTLNGRLKQNRLGLYNKPTATKKAAKQGAQGDNQELEKQYNALQAQMVSIREQYDQSLADKDQLKKQLKTEQTHTQALQSQVQALHASMEALNRDHRHLFANLTKVSQLSDDALARIDALQKQHQSELAHLEQQLAEQRQENKELLAELMRQGEEQEGVEQRLAELSQHTEQDFIDRLARYKVSMSVWAPGVGTLTLDPEQLLSYVEAPEAFAAKRCGVSLGHYQAWLKHYNQPICSHCSKPTDRIAKPADFIDGHHSFCDLHRMAFGRPAD